MRDKLLLLTLFILMVVGITLQAKTPVVKSVGDPLPGDLDTTFGNGGLVTTPINSPIADVADEIRVQPDGKIIVAGHVDVNGGQIGLVRYLHDGSLDTTFGTGGIKVTSINGNDFVWGMTLQPDGKIIVVGTTGPSDAREMYIARFHTNGSLDTSFATTGILKDIVLGINEGMYNVVVLPDGKIIGIGSASNGSYFLPFLLRYNSNGTRDTTFGNNGLITTDVGGGNFGHILRYSDGRLLVSGYIDNGVDDGVMLARFQANGTLDKTFDDDGLVVTNDVPGALPTAIDLQTDDKIVVAGSVYVSSPNKSFIMRYLTDGTLDTTFDGDGIVITEGPVSDEDTTGDMSLDIAGRIVVVGQRSGNVKVARYNQNGSLDTSFDNDDGIVTISGAGFSSASGMAIQRNDGRILATGFGSVPGFLTVRLVGSVPDLPYKAYMPAVVR